MGFLQLLIIIKMAVVDVCEVVSQVGLLGSVGMNGGGRVSENGGGQTPPKPRGLSA